MKIEELKQKYYWAKAQHERFEKGYETALTTAKQYFMNNNYEKAQEHLDFAKKVLKAAADAREEVDKYQKELIRRKASY